MRQPLSSGASLDDYVQANLAQIEQMASVVKPISRQSVTLAARIGARLQYKLTVNVTGRPTTLSLTQYLFVNGSNAYILICSTKADDSSQCAPIFDQITQMLRLE